MDREPAPEERIEHCEQILVALWGLLGSVDWKESLKFVDLRREFC